MKKALIVAMVLILAGCGGNRSDSSRRGSSAVYMPTASGPLKSACLASDRKARSSTLCGCIQAVANDTLSSSDQRRAVRFYSDPHLAQDVRQSSRDADKRFWKSYSDYGKRAALICR